MEHFGTLLASFGQERGTSTWNGVQLKEGGEVLKCGVLKCGREGRRMEPGGRGINNNE